MRGRGAVPSLLPAQRKGCLHDLLYLSAVANRERGHEKSWPLLHIASGVDPGEAVYRLGVGGTTGIGIVAILSAAALSASWRTTEFCSTITCATLTALVAACKAATRSAGSFAIRWPSAA